MASILAFGLKHEHRFERSGALKGVAYVRPATDEGARRLSCDAAWQVFGRTSQVRNGRGPFFWREAFSEWLNERETNRNIIFRSPPILTYPNEAAISGARDSFLCRFFVSSPGYRWDETCFSSSPDLASRAARSEIWSLEKVPSLATLPLTFDCLVFLHWHLSHGPTY